MKTPLRAHAALIAMVIIWGVNFSVSKVALRDVSPLVFNALRFPLAALMLFVVLAMRKTLILPRGRRDWVRLLLVGLVGNVVYQLCFIFGLDHTTAGNASLLLAGTPILTALFSALLGHERVSPRTWLGVSCAFLGIVLIVLGGAPSSEGHRATLIGDALMLGASMTWAFYTVGSRPLVQQYGALPVTAWTLWIGAIGLCIAGASSVARTDLAALRTSTWLSIAYAGLLSIGLSYMFWYYGVSRLGNTRTSSYSNVTPVVALICAWLTLGEKPRLAQVVGAAIIIAGVSIAQTTVGTWERENVGT